VEPFEGETLWTLQQLDQGEYPLRLIEADRAVPQFPAVKLDLADARAIRQGKLVSLPAAAAAVDDQPAGAVRLYDEQERFFGLGERSAAGLLKAKRLYASS
jgi:tRNA U55 pseudouridine synthase TruB